MAKKNNESAILSTDISTISIEEFQKMMASAQAKQVGGGDLLKLEKGQSFKGVYVKREISKVGKEKKSVPVYTLESAAGNCWKLLGSAGVAKAFDNEDGSPNIPIGASVAIARFPDDIEIPGRPQAMHDIRVFVIPSK